MKKEKKKKIQKKPMEQGRIKKIVKWTAIIVGIIIGILLLDYIVFTIGAMKHEKSVFMYMLRD